MKGKNIGGMISFIRGIDTWRVEREMKERDSNDDMKIERQ